MTEPSLRQRFVGVSSAWFITSTLIGISLVMGVVFLDERTPLHATIEFPWWAMVVAFALVESSVVHLHFRSETGSFSLFELPLVLGLIFVAPQGLWLAAILGVGFALTVVRRQPAIKVAFNVANLSVHVSVAALVAQTFITGDPLAPTAWLILAAATTLGGAIQIVALAAVLYAAEEVLGRRQILTMLGTATVISTANTAQALVAAVLVQSEPISVLLLLVPVAVMLVAYRAYVAERNQREQVEFLYTSTKALRESAETTSSAAALLGEVVSMFRAERAHLLLLPREDRDEVTTTHFRHENGATVAHVHDTEDEIPSRLAEFASTVTLVESLADIGSLAEFFANESIESAMVGTLRGANRNIGVLIAANRLGQVAAFTREDLRLFETLVQQAAVALENDQLEEALDEMTRLERKLAHQAHHDVLTGLANRARFSEELARSIKADEAPSILYLDLDDFKVINDTLGHGAGDHVLAEVGRRVQALVRPTDTVARLGGDEFAVLLPGSDQADVVARRVIQSLHEIIHYGDHELQIGVSIGLARARSASEDPASLLNDADIAMYAAKSKGKGALVEFVPEMRQRVSKQRRLQTQLRRAVDHDEFEVVYQPIVEPSSGTLVGAEALVRWNSEGRQETPDTFIPEAERAGLIVSIDRTVLVKAATVFEVLPQNDRSFISVNLSAQNFLEDDLADYFARTLMVAGVDPHRVVVEVTETALIRDPDRTVQQLADLRALGLRIALDDFGTGYSSLSYLHRLPVDILKIAQPFIADVENDETFVRTMIDLGKNLGLQIVAEGVETEAQRLRVAELGCDMAQGYLFGRPSSLTDLMAMMVTTDAV
ncbi:MAG: putative bifunctional diguanylate cyclase/phosphodiesterase [Acidimicrobiales bacterium]